MTFFLKFSKFLIFWNFEVKNRKSWKKSDFQIFIFSKKPRFFFQKNIFRFFSISKKHYFFSELEKNFEIFFCVKMFKLLIYEGFRSIPALLRCVWTASFYESAKFGSQTAGGSVPWLALVGLGWDSNWKGEIWRPSQKSGLWKTGSLNQKNILD